MSTTDTVRGLLDGRVDIENATQMDVAVADVLIRAAYRGGTVDGLRKALEKGDNMIKDTIKEILDKPVKHEDYARDLVHMGIEDPTFRDYLVIMVLTRTASTGTADDLRALAEIMGECGHETSL